MYYRTQQSGMAGNVILKLYLLFALSTMYDAKPAMAKSKEFFTVSKVPTNSRPMMLFARTGVFLEIFQNGTVQGTSNRNSINAILEMQSFGPKLRRIKLRGSELYLAIDIHGKVNTEKYPNAKTLFREEIDDRSWIRYQSTSYGWMLALKKKGKTKKSARRAKLKQRSTQFLPLFLIQWQ